MVFIKSKLGRFTTFNKGKYNNLLKFRGFYLEDKGLSSINIRLRALNWRYLVRTDSFKRALSQFGLRDDRYLYGNTFPQIECNPLLHKPRRSPLQRLHP